VSGGLALLRAFGHWKIEHEARKKVPCERLRNKVGREGDTGFPYDSGCKQYARHTF